jgi:hypothetical protein
MGRPEHALFFGHGIGDDLLCTAVARELKKRGAGRIVMFSRHPSLFTFNPDIHAVYGYGYGTAGRRRYARYSTIIPQFSNYDQYSDKDVFRDEHVITTMCRIAGITGGIKLRPYLNLSAEEMQRGRICERQVVIQSAGLASGPGVMKNKEWYPERFQQVVDQLRGELSFVQLGNEQDPPLRGVIDLRGKTSLRESAAILSRSQVFIGQVGFQMHLARAVDCRGVIVFGGRENPAVSGYECNENIVKKTLCSPCWQRNRCDYDRKCMRMIEPEHVVTAVQRQLDRCGSPLVPETADII